MFIDIIKDNFYTLMGEIIIITSFFLIISLLLITIGKWQAFKKAGKNKWAALIPVYDKIVFLEIAELPISYLILYFIPFVNIYIIFKGNIEFAKKYGLNTLYGVGLVFAPFVFWLIIGFNTTKYCKDI